MTNSFDIGRIAFRPFDGLIVGKIHRFQLDRKLIDVTHVYSLQKYMDVIELHDLGETSFPEVGWNHTISEVVTNCTNKPGHPIITETEWQLMCKKNNHD